MLSQDLFYLPPVLLPFQNPKPFPLQSTISPNLVMWETLFKVRMRLKTDCLEHGPYSIAQLDRQPVTERFILTLMFAFICDVIENGTQYWAAIIRMENLLPIHLLLTLHCIFVSFLSIMNDPVLLIRVMLRGWAHWLAHVIFNAMLGIAGASIWMQWICRI